MSHKTRATAADFDPAVMRLFDQYVHGDIDRRAFLKRAAGFAAGAAGALGLLSALSPRFAEAQQIKPDDSRIHTEYCKFPSPDGYGKGRGYLARPAEVDQALPMVLVIHENRGLNPHIEDITRRLALEGYLAFAPDALFPLGGYPGDEDSARSLFAQLDQSKTRADFLAAVAWFLPHKSGNGQLGAVGFCYGGAISNFLATRIPELKAAAPYYGSAPALDDVSKIKAEMLIVLAANDERVNSGWPAYEEALKAAKVSYRLLQPADTVHGFNNDTTPRYNEQAAALVWRETLDLFKRQLHTPAA